MWRESDFALNGGGGANRVKGRLYINNQPECRGGMVPKTMSHGESN